MEDKYKYNEPMVRFYDAIYDKMAGPLNKHFYIDKMVNARGPVLEIGCGTGRLFCEALKQGADVYGIDHSELMLNVLKNKIDEKDHHRVKLVDAKEFFLSERKYNLIIAPFRVFQHIYEVKDQISFLKNIKNNLAEGGEFIFDVFNPDLKTIAVGYEENLQCEAEYAPGKIIKRFHKAEPDVLNQQMLINFRFEWDEDNETKHAEFYTPMRYYFRYELEHLIARSGLKMKCIDGDFEGSEFSAKSANFVVKCGIQFN